MWRRDVAPSCGAEISLGKFDESAAPGEISGRQSDSFGGLSLGVSLEPEKGLVSGVRTAFNQPTL
jgi:hypothetical protein